MTEAILFLEYAVADRAGREAVRERLSALALLGAARMIFAATEEASGLDASSVVALGFSDAARARAALDRWRNEGALPVGATARLLAAEQAQAPILLFP